MSKTKSKKGKKTESQETVPLKSVFDILLDKYKNPETLTLAQQKYIIDVLGLNDNSLYDGISIDIITDCIRYCMKLQLQPQFIECIYRILQNAIYKIKNELDFEEQQLTEFLTQQLHSKLPVKPVENEDPNKSIQANSENNNKNIDYITNKTLECIQAFIEGRISTEYTVYRAALFKNNPSNIQYEIFKDSMDVGDIVKFHNEQHLSQIKELKDNYVVLQLLDQNNQIEFIVSKDQTKYLKFVSKAPSEADKILMVLNDKERQNKEIQDNGGNITMDDQIMVANENEVNENENENDIDIAGNAQVMNLKMNNMINNECQNQQTLIDLIVQQKVRKALESMQKELDQCKQEINELRSKPTN